MQVQAKHIMMFVWALAGAALTGGIDALTDQLTTGQLDLFDYAARRRLLMTALTGGLVAANMYLKHPHEATVTVTETETGAKMQASSPPLPLPVTAPLALPAADPATPVTTSTSSSTSTKTTTAAAASAQADNK